MAADTDRTQRGIQSIEVGGQVPLALVHCGRPMALKAVRLEESPAAVHVTMRHGTVFSLTNPASGRLFAAYRDVGLAKQRLQDARRRRSIHADASTPGMSAPAPLPSWREFERQLIEVRAHGLSRSAGEVQPGENALAAPVFDPAGAIVLCFTAIGPAPVFDTRWDGALARARRECADQVSHRLGAPVAGGVRS